MNISIALKIILLSIFAIPGTNVFGSSDVQVFVASSNGNLGLDMKATETREVSGFIVKPESVVQITEGENLVVSTQPPDRVDNVKVTDSTGVMTKLVSIGNNAYSLLGYAPGVYVLDVIVDIGDERAAYETILVILKQGQPPIQPIEVINKVKVVTDVRVTFEDDDDGECSNKEGSAGLAFPYGKRTECELEKKQDCEKDKLAGKIWGDDCKDNNHAFDDDCEGFANQKECDEASKNPKIPVCDDNTPAGQLCRDEIDDCFDESGCTVEEIDCPAHEEGCPVEGMNQL
jgi:hypothetical protein